MLKGILIFIVKLLIDSMQTYSYDEKIGDISSHHTLRVVEASYESVFILVFFFVHLN